MAARSLQTILLCLCASACTSAATVKQDSPTYVDISSLVADPSAYEGDLLAIRGAAVIDFEAWYICSSAAVIESGHPRQCLWLHAGHEKPEDWIDLGRFHLKNVELVGRVNLRSKGHMGLFGSSFNVVSGKVLGRHGVGGFPPPRPCRPSAN